VQELRFPSFVSIVDVIDYSRPSPEDMVFVIERPETVAVNFDTADVVGLQCHTRIQMCSAG
jgi:hypothetical protein